MMSKIINIQQIMENKISLEEARDMLVMHQGEVYKFFDEGNTRYVFVNEDKTKVIKLVKSDIGINYNEEEAKIYENASDEDKEKMAEARLVNGFIEQDFCLPIKFGGRKLTLAQRVFASKCRNEVGWTEDGELVCFDLDEYMKY